MKCKLKYKEIVVDSAITKLKRRIPYGWDLNVYRGCQHSCRYCYAMYSHKYLGSEDFFQDIYVKVNIVDELEKQLSSSTWQGEVVNVGGVTDSYQPAEEIYQFMPEILKLMIRYKNPIIISTKSNLILRDYDLIDELSRLTYVNIASTITTVDEEIRRQIEPGTVTTCERFGILKKFRKTSASIGVHMMPIIPFITDSRENLEKIFSFSKECNVDYLLPGTLYLTGNTRKYFLDFIEEEFPHLSEEFKKLYKTGGADKEYKNQLYKVVNELWEKHNISGNYMRPLKERLYKNGK